MPDIIPNHISALSAYIVVEEHKTDKSIADSREGAKKLLNMYTAEEIIQEDTLTTILTSARAASVIMERERVLNLMGQIPKDDLPEPLYQILVDVTADILAGNTEYSS